MHSAFELRAIIEDLPLTDRIESLAFHGDRVFVGRASGILEVYSVQDGKLVKTAPALTKKPIEQLGIIKEINSIVILSNDGNLTLADIHTLKSQTVLSSHTKSAANIFALDTSIRSSDSSLKSEPGPPILCTTLAVGCKRRLVLFGWKDGEWQEPREIALPHQIRSLTFPTESTLVLGYSTNSYGSVNVPTPGSADALQLEELLIPSMPASTEVATTGGALGGLGGLALKTGGYMGLGGIGRVDRNNVISVGRGEVLITRDNIGLFLQPDGSPGRGSIDFGQEPEGTVFSPPYIVSLLPPTSPSAPPQGQGSPLARSTTQASAIITVHLASDAPALIQTFAIPPPPLSVPASLDFRAPQANPVVRLLTALPPSSTAAGKHLPILILSHPSVPSNDAKATVWSLTMKSWDAQLNEMESFGEYAAALDLLSGRAAADAAPPPDPVRLRKLRVLNAVVETFTLAKDYETAIDVFIELETTPARVVTLYPDRIAGRLALSNADAFEEAFGGRMAAEVRSQREREAQKNLRPPSEPNKVDTPPTGSWKFGSPAKSKRQELVNALTSTNDETGSIRSVKSRKSAAQIPDTLINDATKIAEMEFYKSVDALVRYLTDRRQHVNKALAALRPTIRPTPSSAAEAPLATSEELLMLPDAPLTSLSPLQLQRVAQTVDTALFKCYLAIKPSLLGPLCRLDNWCEIAEVEGLLLDAKRYRELLDLYNGKDEHEKALKLLRRMSDEDTENDDAQSKLEPTIRYLHKLGSDYLDIIFDASKWVFEVDRGTGLTIFTADLEEVESLPRHAVASHLERIGSDVAEKYLEHIIHRLGEQGPEFHEKLIEMYMVRAKDEDPKRREGGPEVRQKLLAFLETSTQYRADRLLGRLQQGKMYEIRAVLLGRLGQHEGALQIYVQRLKDFQKAEEYCQKVYTSSPDKTGSVYLILLRLYLRPKISDSPLLLKPALDLLARNGSRVDAVAILDLLPPLEPLSSTSRFLTLALRQVFEDTKNASIERSVYRSYIDELDSELVQFQSRRVKLTDGRICPYCHKRLGNSVIAVHSPRGEVTHFSCRIPYQQQLSSHISDF